MRNFKTATHLGAWIDCNVPEVLHDGSLGEMIINMVASEEAQIILDNGKGTLIKEMISGIGPIDLDYVNDWLDEKYKYWGSEEEVANAQITEVLRAYFYPEWPKFIGKVDVVLMMKNKGKDHTDFFDHNFFNDHKLGMGVKESINSIEK